MIVLSSLGGKRARKEKSTPIKNEFLPTGGGGWDPIPPTPMQSRHWCWHLAGPGAVCLPPIVPPTEWQDSCSVVNNWVPPSLPVPDPRTHRTWPSSSGVSQLSLVTSDLTPTSYPTDRAGKQQISHLPRHLPALPSRQTGNLKAF